MKTQIPEQPYFLPINRGRKSLIRLLISSLLGAAVPAALAANWAWDTSPGSGNFNDTNWTSGTIPGAGAGTPASADSLYFGASSQPLLTNDFSGVTFNGLNFNSGANAFTLGGNAITLGGDIVNNSASLQTINLNLALNAARTVTTAAGGGDVTLGGNISGAFALTNSGPGALTLSGINTYTNSTTVNGGTLNYSGSLTATAAPFFVNNARLNVSGALSFNRFLIGDLTDSAGAVYQAGGSVTLNQAAGTDNFRIGSGTNGYGYYNFSGGTLNVAQANITSAGTRGNNTVGVLEISGGSFTSSDRFAVGTGTTAGRGVATVSGGTLNFSTTANGLSLIANGANGVGSGVTGILNVGGGTTAAQVIGPSTTTAGRGLVLAGVNITNSLAVANLLPNGTLTVNGVSATQPSPTNLFNFNGGTLKAAALNLGASFFNSANIPGVYVYGNGGTIDNNSTTITIGNKLLAPTGSGIGGIASFTGGAGYLGAPFVAFSRGAGDTTGFGATAIVQIDSSIGGATSGQVTNVLITNPGNGYTTAPIFTLTGGGATTPATITGNAPTANVSGGLAFIGSGKTTLSGVSTYTGATIVSGGTLALSGTASIAGSSAIIVGSGATFDVSGLSSTFTLGAAQTLSNSVSIAWLKGNVNANGGTLALNYSSGSPAFTVTNGTFSLSAGTVVQVNNTGTQLAPGNYLLIATNSGAQVSGFVPLTVAVGGAGVNGYASLQLIGGQLYLNVGPASVVGYLNAPANPAGYLDSLTYSLHVVDLLNGQPAATGSVVFAASGIPFSTNDVVAGSTSSAAIGNLPRSAANLITAIYSGDANHPALTNSLFQAVTNHPPVAGNISYARVTGQDTVTIPISDLLNTTSDLDGDTVSFVSVDSGLRGITPVNTGTALLYTNPNNINDVLTYTVTDGFGGTATGKINIARHLLPGQTARHNILLIIADDLGADGLALFNTNSGVSLPPAPNLDRLGRSGVAFTHFYARPSCSQFRAALFTGLNSIHNGVGTANMNLRSNEYTLPRAFTTNAPEYGIASFGKWHLAPTTEANSPWTYGGWTNYAGFFGTGVANYTNWTKFVNGTSFNTAKYSTTDQIDDTISFVQSQGTNRWFVWLALNAPHVPRNKPPTNLAPTYAGLSGAPADIAANPRPYWEAMVEAADTEIGRLLTVVDTNETDIIFVGDNGTERDVQQLPYKNPIAPETTTGNGHAKFTVYEGGVRTPLFITGPSVVNGGRANDSIVDTTDIYQTIQELASIDVAASLPAGIVLDSKSIVPALKADVVVPQSYLLGGEFNQSAAGDGVTLRNDKYKLIHFYNHVERFYDLENDPYEFTNLLTSALTPVAQANFNALKLKLGEYQTFANTGNTRNLVPYPQISNVGFTNGTFNVSAQFTQFSTNGSFVNPNQPNPTRLTSGGTNLNYQVILWRNSDLGNPLGWIPVLTNVVAGVTNNFLLSTNGWLLDPNANADHNFYRISPYIP